VRSRAATIVTAVAEIALGVTLGLVWIAAHRQAHYAAIAEAGFYDIAGRAEFDERNVYRYFGNDILMVFSFFLSARGLLASFLVVEGAVRFLHSVFHDEGCGFFLPWIWRLVRQWRRSRRRALPDRISRWPDGTLAVIGPPRDWDALTTFVHGGQMYTLARQVALGELVRYELREAPASHLVRNLVNLDEPPAAPPKTGPPTTGAQ
jgi:hypothetical protein